jgi:transposase
MILIGVDVHKHSLTATAVDELGRALAERRGPVESEVVAWARALGEERLWAVEDCRHVTRGLEQTLLGKGERLVRVPPRLTAPQSTRPSPRQVRLDRRARGRTSRAAGAVARWSAHRRGDAAGAEAAR